MQDVAPQVTTFARLYLLPLGWKILGAIAIWIVGGLVVRLIRINEYKRRQAPVGIRVTHRGFGKDWRYPITSKYRA